MRANRHLSHVVVLPEDDANARLAGGFQLHPLLVTRNFEVMRPAGGWMKLLEQFRADHVRRMEQYPRRLMVLMIDFDKDEGRLSVAMKSIPDHLAGRVFVLGVLSEPEKLKSEMRLSYETIGENLAQDCHARTNAIWSHPLLKHNQSEIARMQENLTPILFPA